MKAIGRAVLILGLGTGVAACDGEGPTGPEDFSEPGLVPEPAASVVQGPRPFQGHMEGVVVAGAPCSVDPPGISLTAIASGTATHLGAATVLQTSCVVVSVPTLLGPSYISFTSAKGDRLDGVLTDLTFTPVGFDMDFAVMGGTGRFDRAGGTFTADVTQSGLVGPSSVDLHGWIEY